MFFFITKARSTRSFFYLSSCPCGEIPKSILLLCLALLLLPGCGRKTPAIPPGAVIPQAISDLGYQLNGQDITLSWSYPRLSVDKAPIENIRSFVVQRATIAASDFCPNCPVQYSKKFTISAQGLDPGAPLVLHDQELASGKVYIYSVRSHSGWQITSPPSNKVVVRVESPLPSPAGLAIDQGDQQLTLQWQAVSTRLDGSSPAEQIRYQVWRRTDHNPFQPIGSLTTSPEYRDVGLLNEQPYDYQVTAVTGPKDQAHSLPSRVVSGRPVDMAPPLPPKQLAIVALEQGARLFWQGSPDSDVEGYHIYRRQEGDEPQRIASVAKGAISYADNSALAPGLYFYSVAAFDAGSRHNESARPVEVRLTVP